jgi:phospholipid/cholesterol/gamma-HCH transport system substrate-binding protein
MKRFGVEATVGLFVVLGVLALAYLSVQLGQLQIMQGGTYTVTTVFPTVAGLRVGARVEIAGVQIGRVQKIALEDFAAVVHLRLVKQVQLQEDAIASIRTRGLIGEKYMRLTPGGSERLIPAGGSIREVETPVDYEDLIGQFIQGKL